MYVDHIIGLRIFLVVHFWLLALKRWQYQELTLACDFQHNRSLKVTEHTVSKTASLARCKQARLIRFFTPQVWGHFVEKPSGHLKKFPDILINLKGLLEVGEGNILNLKGVENFYRFVGNIQYFNILWVGEDDFPMIS